MSTDSAIPTHHSVP